MDSLSRAQQLPAQRLDAAGRAHVDQRAVIALALPLMANSAVQIVLNLTDMWFMGRISTRALAAVGAVQWLVIVAVLVLGGAGTAVQTLVAQNFGARRYRRAGQAVWTALWAMACAAPLVVLVGAARHLILAPFGFDPQVEQLASAFWFPRVGGACVGAAVWAMLGFFNGIGRPRVTLLITIVTTVTNALLNQLFIFRLGHQRRAGDGSVVCGGDFCAGRLSSSVPLAPDVAAAPRRAAAAAAPRGAHGAVAGGGSAGIRHLSDDADAARHGGRRRHADGGDPDFTCLHAGVRHCFRGHDAGGASHRRGGARLGAAGRQPRDRARGPLHGRYRRADCARRSVGTAVFRRLARCRGGHRGRARHAAAVAGGRLPVLRRPESRQQHVPARRGRCQDPGDAGAGGIAAAVRAAGACLHVCARRGLGALPAAIRLGRRRRLGCGTHLCHGAGEHAVPALALPGLAENPPLSATARAPTSHVHYAQVAVAYPAAAAGGPAVDRGRRGLAAPVAYLGAHGQGWLAAARCGPGVAVAAGDAAGGGRAGAGRRT